MQREGRIERDYKDGGAKERCANGIGVETRVTKGRLGGGGLRAEGYQAITL